MNSNISILKRNIKEERRRKKLKVYEICNYIGKDRFYLNQMVNPSFNTVIDISKAIGCKVSDLFKDL